MTTEGNVRHQGWLVRLNSSQHPQKVRPQSLPLASLGVIVSQLLRPLCLKLTPEYGLLSLPFARLGFSISNVNI